MGGGLVREIVFQPPGTEAWGYPTLLALQEEMGRVKKSNGDLVHYVEILPPRFKTELVILYSHGNAEDIGICMEDLLWTSERLGVVIIAYDYCGYGFSGPPGARPGANPSKLREKSVYEDADAMYAEVTRKYTERNVVLMGRSVGGGPSCYLARQHHDRIAGLILQSTFTSCFGVIDNQYRFCLAVAGCCSLACCCKCQDLFPNEKNLAETLACPIFIMHGTADTVVPHKCSLKLLETVTKTRQRCHRKAGLEAQKVSRLPESSRENPLGSARGSRRTARSADPLVKYGEKYLRVFPRGADQTETPLELQLGIFSSFFEGCDHNDIEANEPVEFCREMCRFLKFCSAVRNGLREPLADIPEL